MNEHAQEKRPAFLSGVAALWASAFVLMALIVVSASGFFESTAHADEMKSGGMSAMSVASAADQEQLLVVDERLGHMFIYEFNVSRKQIVLVAHHPIEELFPQDSPTR
ncbi:MAG: hypothetical protein AAGB34_05805 [Planctomycetota bacterium]